MKHLRQQKYRIHLRQAILLERVALLLRRVSPHQPLIPRLPARLGIHVSCLASDVPIPQRQSVGKPSRPNLLRQTVTRSQLNRHLPVLLGTHVSCLASVVLHPPPQSAAIISRVNRRQPVATSTRLDLLWLAATKSRPGTRLPAPLVIFVSGLASVVPHPVVIPSRPSLLRQVAIKSPPNLPVRPGTCVSCMALVVQRQSVAALSRPR